MLAAMVALLLTQASLFDEPVKADDVPQPKRPARWGGALDLGLGGVVYQRAETGDAPTRFDVNVRAEVFVRAHAVFIGGFTALAATIGQDLRLGVGPVLVVPLGDLFDMVVAPGFYERHTSVWEPGFNAGLALRWVSGLGIGVEGRLGLGETRERAFVVSGQIELLRAISSLLMPRGGANRSR